jgi:DNA-binding LacI/PurR family transcriptional regulator
MKDSDDIPSAGRRPTLADVAHEAQVSVPLVSLVMRGAPGASPANREKVLRVARELGYVPDSRARALRRGRSHLLGVMFDVQQPFQADVLESIYSSAELAGYDVVLSGITETRTEERAVSTLLADRCEALLLLAPKASRDRLAEIAARLPVVVVTRGVRHADISVVRTAEARGTRLAVDHLVSLGHSRIAHIDGGPAPATEQRRRGYRAAMVRYGLDPQVVHGGDAERDGTLATEGLISQAIPPTAILAFNDRCATGVLDALHRAGCRVPEEFSVVGFDDMHLAGFSHIALTTVRQDAPLLGRMAVERAIDRIEGRLIGAGPDVVVPPALVSRATSGPLLENPEVPPVAKRSRRHLARPVG